MKQLLRQPFLDTFWRDSNPLSSGNSNQMLWGPHVASCVNFTMICKELSDSVSDQKWPDFSLTSVKTSLFLRLANYPCYLKNVAHKVIWVWHPWARATWIFYSNNISCMSRNTFQWLKNVSTTKEIKIKTLDFPPFSQAQKCQSLLRRFSP